MEERILRAAATPLTQHFHVWDHSPGRGAGDAFFFNIGRFEGFAEKAELFSEIFFAIFFW